MDEELRVQFRGFLAELERIIGQRDRLIAAIREHRDATDDACMTVEDVRKVIEVEGHEEG